MPCRGDQARQRSWDGEMAGSKCGIRKKVAEHHCQENATHQRQVDEPNEAPSAATPNFGSRAKGVASMAKLLDLVLNGRKRSDAVCDNVLLLDYLREVAGLTGTKTGCDGGECGACTVLVEDQPRLSCLTLAATVN